MLNELEISEKGAPTFDEVGVDLPHAGLKKAADDPYETTLKVLAVVGLIVLLLGAAWVGVRLLKFTPRAVSGMANSFVAVTSFVFPFERIELVSNTQMLRSGTPFRISWRHIRKGDEGSYSFFYPCKEDLYFIAETNEGGKTAVCNTPFNFLNTSNTLLLTPVLSSEEGVDVPLTIRFIENGEDIPKRVGKEVFNIVNPSTLP